MLNSLKKIVCKSKKRVGRGYGSKKGGHTSTRGSKGAKARYKIRLTFDGTKIKKGWIKRLPLLRGKNKNNSQRLKLAVDLDQLEKWYKAKAVVTRLDLLQKLNIKKSDLKRTKVKVLSRGSITKALTVTVPCTKNATQKILVQGGKVTTNLKTNTGSVKIKG